MTTYLAQLSTEGATGWLTANAIPLAAIVIGLVAMMAAAKQDLGKIASMLIGVVLAFIVIGIGIIPGASESVARFIAGLFTGA
ncbi:hypothetical protein [Pseudonocardia sp. WMMC193]|uniref:hypothetical protein n=1 Tax=Pseudonocardia sp. WMMC193 TaxID=2911965 RepID=UPI001F29A8AC|nr:hypothetical protein [Pseudonocardia sp. WMMC193]MCF7552574.1 hypothetical protein [Pseudonocardia sp. WMMC193]